MKNTFELQNEYIQKMDVICEKLGIEWHKGSNEIRSVMNDAFYAGLKLGVEQGRLLEKQDNCAHTYSYDLKGGECRKCGAVCGQDSSD